MQGAVKRQHIPDPSGQASFMAAGDRRREWSAERERWFAAADRTAENAAAAWKLKEMTWSLWKFRLQTELEMG